MPESAIVDRSAIERYNEKCVREIENACEQKRCMKETPAAIPGRGLVRNISFAGAAGRGDCGWRSFVFLNIHFTGSKACGR